MLLIDPGVVIPHMLCDVCRLPGLKANAGGTGRARPKTRREPTVTIDRSNREEYLTVLEDIADILPQEKIGDSDASIVDAYRKLHVSLLFFLCRAGVLVHGVWLCYVC